MSSLVLAGVGLELIGLGPEGVEIDGESVTAWHLAYRAFGHLASKPANQTTISS